MKYCPLCETDYPDDVNVCPQDGTIVRRPGERPDPLVGRVLKERYRIERQLGRGGMGTVYLAEQLSIRRKVALKVLSGDFARDDGFVARFRQEATLVAGLNEKRNPRVTLVYDFDQTEDGSVFIVMEWLEGRLLSEVIQREGPLSLSRAVRLATQIAEGLEAAHRAGVVHRDIKPQNIMVLNVGDDIKLMDFGIARLLDSDRTSLTRAGTMMGTPDYMAPEQIEGQEITDKTDIYAFGIVFYEMLTGTVPFKARTQAAVLTKQLQEQPVPPTRLRPEVPPDVEVMVLKALEKNPARRERNMGEIVRALREISRHLGDSPRAESPFGDPTIVIDTAPGKSVQTVALTVLSSPQFTEAQPEPSEKSTASLTFVDQTPEKSPPSSSEHRSSWSRHVIVGGLAAAVLVVGVALVVYLVAAPPPSPNPGDSGPVAQGPARSASSVVPPFSSAGPEPGTLSPPEHLRPLAADTPATSKMDPKSEAVAAAASAAPPAKPRSEPGQSQNGDAQLAQKAGDIESLRKAAEAGDVAAMYALGETYLKIKGQGRTRLLAIPWYRKAAAAGHAGAMERLGGFYQYGLDVEKNAQEAVRLYRKAADAGNRDAMYSLGLLYILGDEGVERNEAEGNRWIRRAAEAGVAPAMYLVGVGYANQGNEPQAIRWIRNGAEKGHIDAMLVMGNRYANGKGVERNDVEAAKWFRRAAEADNITGMSVLGVFYELGRGVEKDDAQATRWYRHAAEGDDPSGMRNLARMYESGRGGLEKDEDEAAHWYRKAAKWGDLDAMHQMGQRSETGRGMVKDYAAAVAWYRKAAGYGYEPSKDRLKELGESL